MPVLVDNWYLNTFIHNSNLTFDCSSNKTTSHEIRLCTLPPQSLPSIKHNKRSCYIINTNGLVVVQDFSSKITFRHFTRIYYFTFLTNSDIQYTIYEEHSLTFASFKDGAQCCTVVYSLHY